MQRRAVAVGDRWRFIDHTLGLPWAAIRSLFVDREGTLWVGGSGLAQLRGRGLVEHHDSSSGLIGGDAWSFRRDAQGTLWAGTGQCLARAHAGRWECLAGTEGRTVRSFVFPPQGGVFVGGAPSDLQYVGPEGGTTSLGANSADRTIFALALGPDDDLWIATDSGIDRLLRGTVTARRVPCVYGYIRCSSIVGCASRRSHWPNRQIFSLAARRSRPFRPMPQPRHRRLQRRSRSRAAGRKRDCGTEARA